MPFLLCRPILRTMEKQLLELARYGHGFFNIALAVLFLYQAWLGLRVRKSRSAGAPDYGAIRTHRRLGPPLAFLGILGFLFGMVLVRLDTGKGFQYPLHAVLGLMIALSLAATYTVSRRIKAGPAWRMPHLILGVVIIILYVVQVMVGLDVLF